MNSGSSTDPGQPGRAAGIRVWHFYLLLSLGAATWAVIASRDTHPAALLLLSSAIFAAGFVGAASHRALLAFLTPSHEPRQSAISATVRADLEADKAHVLRSLKELEFDRNMGKLSDADFAEVSARLRARAMDLIRQLDAAPVAAPAPVPETPVNPARFGAEGRPTQRPAFCGECGTGLDADARFCKQCGARVT